MHQSAVNTQMGDSLQYWRGNEDFEMADIYFYPAVGGPVSPAAGSYLVAWVKGDFPIGAGPTVVTTSNVTGFSWSGTSGDPWVLGACHLRHFWVSTQSGGSITHGAMVGVGSLGPKVGGGGEVIPCTIRARVRVNNKDRFKFLKFYLTDGVSNNYVSTDDFLGSLTNDTWGEISFTPVDVDVRNWDTIRFSLTACGTDDYTKVGETDFCVEWFKLEIG